MKMLASCLHRRERERGRESGEGRVGEGGRLENARRQGRTLGESHKSGQGWRRGWLRGGSYRGGRAERRGELREPATTRRVRESS